MVEPFRARYERDAALATYAIARLIEDLEAINASFARDQGRVVLTDVEGRVKEQDSFFRKLHRLCTTLAARRGFAQSLIAAAYGEIKDLAGVRFACPYFDEVVHAVEQIVRPGLAAAGYATELRDDGYPDKDLLDRGDDLGYRSYHFFVRVPTVVDIYGTIEPCLCEIQARTELQHVWATKSHGLL